MKTAAIILASGVSIVSAGAGYSAVSSASMLAKVRMENAETSRVYTITTATMEQIRADVDDYSFEGGYLSC